MGNKIIEQELTDAISQLMTPERQKELEIFFKELPPVFQQFLLRFIDVRDSAALRELKVYVNSAITAREDQICKWLAKCQSDSDAELFRRLDVNKKLIEDQNLMILRLEEIVTSLNKKVILIRKDQIKEKRKVNSLEKRIVNLEIAVGIRRASSALKKVRK